MNEQFVCQMIVRLLPTSFPQWVLRRHIAAGVWKPRQRKGAERTSTLPSE
jgi:hypothetical protein